MEKYGKIKAQYKKVEDECQVLNFVICENEKELSKLYKKIVDNFMMNYDTDYKVIQFDGYDKEWHDYVSLSEDFNVYLLDIKTPKGSGLDAARYIREKYDDWKSMIIIITGHPEYKYEALGKRLMLVDFISKLDDSENKLKEALLLCMKNYNNRPKQIKYSYKNVEYHIGYNEIIYIEKEIDSKRCVIITKKRNYYIQETINHIYEKLDDRFIKISRSIIINSDKIKSYDPKENILIMQGAKLTNAVSRSKKKEVMSLVD